MSAAMLIDITNDASTEPYPGWQPDHTRALAQFLLQQLRIPAGSELSIAFLDPEPMAELHQQWLDLPGPTDVMSFPMDEMREGAAAAGHLGDVAICPQVAAAQAAEAQHSPRAEVDLLLTHGVLHLLGHDHAEPEEHAVMFAKQAQLLAAWQTNHWYAYGTATPSASLSSASRDTQLEEPEASAAEPAHGAQLDEPGAAAAEPAQATNPEQVHP